MSKVYNQLIYGIYLLLRMVYFSLLIISFISIPVYVIIKAMYLLDKYDEINLFQLTWIINFELIIWGIFLFLYGFIMHITFEKSYRNKVKHLFIRMYSRCWNLVFSSKFQR